MNLRWFLSRQFRRTSELWKHVLKLRDAQCDLLDPPSLDLLDGALLETKAALDANADDTTLAARTAELEHAAQKFLAPYPNAEWRDNVEVFLVAIIVAMSVRTFFLQPFKIPTGSMQPTLFGVTLQDLRGDPNFKMPGWLDRCYELAVHGSIYHQVIAQKDGAFESAGRLEHFLGVVNKQIFWVSYRDGSSAPITLWGGPDDSASESFERRTGLVGPFHIRRVFRKGEPIVQFVETTGDHLFVDRFTYNFRRPRRGEIIVFKTKDIPQIGSDQFFIKRLIGLPGESVSIGYDRHVRINGLRLDASTPHFQNVYGFDSGAQPRDSLFSGHVLQDDLRSLLRLSRDTLEIREKHYAVFGDNTMNSWDSRFWGDFPQEDIIGRSAFVYWPFSPRFGLNPALTR